MSRELFMALIFADGFDHYGTDAILKASGVWTFNGVGVNLGTTPANARTGGGYITSVGTGANSWASHMFGGSAFIIGAGVAMNLSAAPNANGTGALIFHGDTNDIQDVQCAVVINNDLSVSVKRGLFSGGTVLATSAAAVISTNSYAYIEALCKVDNATGFCIVRVNEVEVLRIEDADTQYETHNRIRGVGFGKVGSTNLAGVDDFVIWDETGTHNNSFLGDMRCRTLLPDANGPVQDFTSTEASAFEALNNVPYLPAENINAATVGDISNFTMTDINDNTSYCAGIVLHTVTNKTDAGACQITPKVVSGIATGTGADIAMGTGDAFYKTVFELDPATSDYWTKAAINAMLIEYERSV